MVIHARTSQASSRPSRSGRVLAAILATGALLAPLFVAPAPSLASQGESLLRAGTFGSASGRPLRRRPPPSRRRHTPYGFLNIGGGVFDPTNQPGSGFYGVFSVGTEVAPPLDLGLQFSWYHRSSSGERFTSSYIDPAGNLVHQTVETQSVSTDLLPFLVIARYRFPVSSQVQPYVGGGIGYEWLIVEGIDRAGFYFQNSYGGFGAQGMAGVNLRANSSVALYGEGVYNISTVSADFYDPYYGVSVRESIGYDGLAFHGGLRFRF